MNVGGLCFHILFLASDSKVYIFGSPEDMWKPCASPGHLTGERQPRPFLGSPLKDWQQKEHKRNHQFRSPLRLKCVMPQKGRFDVILWQVPGVSDEQLSPRDF